MEAHLRARSAPGVPLAAPEPVPMEEEEEEEEGEGSGDGDGQQPQQSGQAGFGPAGEALSQELGLLKASIGMVGMRLKELKEKATKDEEFVQLTARFLHQQADLTSSTPDAAAGSKELELAAQVDAYATAVNRAVEALTKHEEAEAAAAAAEKLEAVDAA